MVDLYIKNNSQILEQQKRDGAIIILTLPSIKIKKKDTMRSLFIILIFMPIFLGYQSCSKKPFPN